MGRLTLELMKHTAPGAHGTLRLLSTVNLRAEGFANFPTYAQHLREQFPLRLEGEPVPRICEGAVCLNDPAAAQAVLAVFNTSRTAIIPTGLTNSSLTQSCYAPRPD